MSEGERPPRDYSFETVFEGETVFVRTVNYAAVGTVVGVDPRHIWLHPAADVIQTGSFRSFFGGTVMNYAVLPTTIDKPAMVSRAGIIRCELWPNKVPNKDGD